MAYFVQDPITGNCYRIHTDESVITDIEAARGQKTNLLLTPGFCDLQVNGGFGVDLNAPDLNMAQVIELNRKLLSVGVTGWCPTIITNSPEAMKHNLKVVGEACQHDLLVNQCVVGIHLEGPYLSSEDGARGAHPKEHIRMPSLKEFIEFQSASGGRIRIITLAPELEGAIPLIRNLTQQGILVAIGHTLANREQIAAAVQAGAVMATHLGNGLPAQLSRHQNPLNSMLLNDTLHASVIFDGHHLPWEMRELMRRTKRVEKMMMVSDATRLVGMQPGIYQEQIGGTVELHANGRLSLAGTPYLAGAAMTLLQDSNAMLETGEFTLEEIIQMAMIQPRELTWHDQESIVLLQKDPKTRQISVVMTAIDNEIIYTKENENE